MEGRGRLREQPGVRRRVHVRPVVERVRVAGPLHPVVARPAAVRLNRPAADHRERPPELVQLCVVDQVATLDHRVGCERVDRAYCACQHLRGQRLLRAKGRAEGCSQAGQERHACRGLGVEHVSIGHVRERREHGARGRAWGELGAVDQGQPGTGTQHAAAGLIAPRALKRGAARRDRAEAPRGGFLADALAHAARVRHHPSERKPRP